MMRKLVIAAALLSTATATPALARDGAAYVGLDAGLLRPNSLKLDYSSATTTIDNALRLHHRWGYDTDLVFGYDFGMFRAEGEIGYKWGQVNGAHSQPAANLAILQSTAITDYNADGHHDVLSGMVNGLVDLGPQDGLN